MQLRVIEAAGFDSSEAANEEEQGQAIQHVSPEPGIYTSLDTQLFETYANLFISL